MWRKWFSLAVLTAVIVSFSGTGLTAEEAGETENTYVIGFHDKPAPGLVEDAGGEPATIWERINACAAELTKEEAARLASEEEIQYVERNQSVEIQAEEGFENWGLEDVQAPGAWEDDVTGEGVDVAVVDTGISTSHPSLDVAGGYSAVSYTDSYNDDNGHGSHTAGIIGAYQPDAGLMGMAPDADLFAVKVLDENGNGSLSQVLSGMEWAIEEDVDIINMSFGMLADSSSMKSMLDKAEDHGIIVTAASGNRGEGEGDTDRVEYPARYDSVIAVGAVDEDHERAYFSASGEAVELSAPGVDIVSTYKDNSYGPLSGTSMATPFVSGAFALLEEAYPDKDISELREMLQDEAVDLGPEGRDERYGYGLLQLPDLSDADVEDKERDEEEEKEEPVEEDIDENPLDNNPIDSPDNETPDAPSNVESHIVSNDDGSKDVYIFWDRTDENIRLHQIYRGGSFYEEVDNGKLFKDEDVAPGTYRYEVTAVNVDDVESDKSTAIEVTVEENSFTWPEKLTHAPVFSDIGDDFWAADAIRELGSRGVMQGTDSGFQPGEAVRRGQAVAVIGRVLDWDNDSSEPPFSDVGRSYFGSGYIATAVEKDVVSGFSDGTFRPNDSMTRGQMAAVLGNVFDFSETDGDRADFKDVDEDTTGADAIAYLAAEGIVSGYDDGTFHPENTVSRAQFASIFYKIGEHLRKS